MSDYIDNSMDIVRALLNYNIDMDGYDYDDIDEDLLDNICMDIEFAKIVSPILYNLLLNTACNMVERGDSTSEFVLGAF